MHYYGCRSCDIDPKLDLGIKYFGSLTGEVGKAFRADQKANPSKFKYKIVRIFTTRESALTLEIMLHAMFDVGRNQKFYNIAKQTSTWYDRTGVPVSPEVLAKRTITLARNRAAPGYIHPLSGKKRSAIHIASSITARAIIRAKPDYINPQKGKKHTKEHNASIAAGMAKANAVPGYIDKRTGTVWSEETKIKAAKIRARRRAEPDYIRPVYRTNVFVRKMKRFYCRGPGLPNPIMVGITSPAR